MHSQSHAYKIYTITLTFFPCDWNNIMQNDKEFATNKIFELEKQLSEARKQEAEMQKLKWKLEGIKEVIVEEDLTLQRKMEEMERKLREKKDWRARSSDRGEGRSTKSER